MRIIIAGGPRTGKTTLATQILQADGFPVRSTDDLIGKLGWSEASAEVAEWFDDPGPWVIEGVAAARALRKWLGAHPTGSPCDAIVYLSVPKVDRTPGQNAMAKGCDTVWNEVRPSLVARGVKIVSAESFFVARGQPQ